MVLSARSILSARHNYTYIDAINLIHLVFGASSPIQFHTKRVHFEGVDVERDRLWNDF